MPASEQPVTDYLQQRLREAEDRAQSYRGEQASRLMPDAVAAARHEGRAHGLRDALDAIEAGGNPTNQTPAERDESMRKSSRHYSGGNPAAAAVAANVTP